jgi:hypothetical protein
LRAPLHGEPLKGGRKNNPDTDTRKGISPKGHGEAARFIAGLQLQPAEELAKAHLIAADFGGSGINTKNLVSTWQRSVNLSTMKVVENRVRDAVNVGQIVFLDVKPLYSGNRLQPYAVRYEGFGVYPDGRLGMVLPPTPLLNVQNVNGQAINLGLR